MKSKKIFLVIMLACCTAWIHVQKISAQSENYVLPGEIAYWNFENNTIDQVGGRTASAEVDFNYADSYNPTAGKAASFNGTSTIVEFPNGDELMNSHDFSLAFWVKASSLNHDGRGYFVFGLGAFYGFQFEIAADYSWCKLAASYEMADGSTASDDIYFAGDGKTKDNGGWQGWTYCKDLTASGGVAALLKDRWAHVVCVYNSSTKVGAMYINGELMKAQDFDLWPYGDSKTGAVGLKYGGQEPTVYDKFALGFIQSREGTLFKEYDWGNYDLPTSNHFEGLLDNLHIFHSALTNSQILALYNAEGPAPTCYGFTVYADADRDGFGDANKSNFIDTCSSVTVFLQVEMTNAHKGEAGGSCSTAPFIVGTDIVEAMGTEWNGWNSASGENAPCMGPFTPAPGSDSYQLSGSSAVFTRAETLIPDANGDITFKFRINHSWDNDELRGVGDGNRHAHIPAGATSVIISCVFDDPTTTVTEGSLLNQYVLSNTDCDDASASVYPGATEVCDNGIDDNCNGVIDLDCQCEFTVYVDADGDSFGGNVLTITVCAITPPTGYSDNNLDCDDDNAAINPNGEEGTVPDGLDNDCNGLVDDFVAVSEVYLNVKTYPNPVYELLTIVLENTLGEADVEISNMEGKILIAKRLDFTVGKAWLSFAGLPQGVYLLRITADGRYWAQRVVKM